MIKVETTDPAGLIKKIDAGIEKGDIETWKRQVHEGVKYYTHSPVQWNQKGYLRPESVKGQLLLYFVWPKESDKSKAVSGVYHGRFSEMLCSHFPDLFSSIETSIP